MDVIALAASAKPRSIEVDVEVDDDARQRPVEVGSDTDEGLVARFVAGDRAAFDELVRRHQRTVYCLSLRYVKNEADAADTTQKTFVRAFRALPRFRGGSSVLSGDLVAEWTGADDDIEYVTGFDFELFAEPDYELWVDDLSEEDLDDVEDYLDRTQAG